MLVPREATLFCATDFSARQYRLGFFAAQQCLLEGLVHRTPKKLSPSAPITTGSARPEQRQAACASSFEGAVSARQPPLPRRQQGIRRHRGHVMSANSAGRSVFASVNSAGASREFPLGAFVAEIFSRSFRRAPLRSSCIFCVCDTRVTAHVGDLGFSKRGKETKKRGFLKMHAVPRILPKTKAIPCAFSGAGASRAKRRVLRRIFADPLPRSRRSLGRRRARSLRLRSIPRCRSASSPVDCCGVGAT